MIFKKLRKFRTLVSRFDSIAIPLEKGLLIKNANIYEKNIDKAIKDSDWKFLNIILEELDDDIALVKQCILDREADRSHYSARNIFGEKLQEVKNIIDQIPSLDCEDSKILDFSLRLKNDLIHMVMYPEEVKFVKDAVDRIEGEIEAITGYIDFKNSTKGKCFGCNEVRNG